MTYIRAVFFDIDGVMVLSEDLHAQKLVAVAADPLKTGAFDPVHGFQISMEDHWNLYVAGKGDHRVYAWLCQQQPNFPLTEEQFIAACEEYYLENRAQLVVRDGFIGAIESFADAGLAIAAVSSGVRSQVDCNIAVAGVNDLLLFSHSADDVEAGKTKPDPTPYLNALREMNTRLRAQDVDHVDIQPHHCLVVEDSGSGATAGVRAGMHVVHWLLVAQAKAHPDAVLVVPHDEHLSDYAGALIGARPVVDISPARPAAR